MSEARLTAAITDDHADVDAIQEDGASRLKAQLSDLLDNPKKRDLALWNELGVTPELIQATPKTLLKANGGKQDVNWRIAVSGLWVAARAQAAMDAYREAATIAEKQKVVKAAAKMTPKGLADFAPRGPKKSEFAAAKERKRNGTRADTEDTKP